MRRLCLAALAVAAWPAAPAAGAAGPPCVEDASGPIGGATGGVNVQIAAAGKVWWCSAAVVAANQDVGTAGYGGGTVVTNALSVNHLLELVHVDPANVGFVAIDRSGGGWSTLDTADLADPSPSFAPGQLPVVWINGNAPWFDVDTWYTRPQRAGDPNDPPGADQAVAQSGAALELHVHSGPLLTVSSSASPGEAGAGQPVSFDAEVHGATPADGALSYTWTFGDGAAATGAQPVHAFTAAGTYRVEVTVAGSGNDSGGAADPLTVTVGSPAGGAAGSGTGSGGAAAAPATGPQAGTGTTAGAAGGGDGGSGGSGTPPAAAPPAGVSSPVPRGTPRPASSRRAQPAAAAPRTGASEPAAHTTGATAATPGAASTSSPATRAALPAAHADVSGRARRPATTPAVGPGRQVAGRILAPLQLVRLQALAAAAIRPAAPARAPAAAASAHASLGATLAGGGVIILLLGASAGAELRARARRPRFAAAA